MNSMLTPGHPALRLLQLRKQFIQDVFLKVLPAFILVFLFFQRFTFVFSLNGYGCVEYVFGVLDKSDRSPVVGNLYAFSAPDLRPFFKLGTKMFKYNVAVPGDKVVITEDQKIFVNDKQLEQFGLPYAYTHFSKSPKDFSGKKILGSDEYWFLGTRFDSFDSRYWGSVSKDKVLGRVYPIF